MAASPKSLTQAAVESLNRLALERAFLYEDPDSFRAGVREALRALLELATPVKTRESALA